MSLLGLKGLRSYTGKLHPKGVLFFRLQVYEWVGILLVEVFKRVGKSVIWVGEMAQRAEQMNFKVGKTFDFWLDSYLNDNALDAVF